MVVENETCISRFQPPVILKLNFVTWQFQIFLSISKNTHVPFFSNDLHTREPNDETNVLEKPRIHSKSIRWSTIFPEVIVTKPSHLVIKYQVLPKNSHMTHKWSTSSNIPQPLIHCWSLLWSSPLLNKLSLVGIRLRSSQQVKRLTMRAIV